MMVWHLFAIVWMADGSYLFDNWVYTTATICEDNKAQLEASLQSRGKDAKAWFVSGCDKVLLGNQV